MTTPHILRGKPVATVLLQTLAQDISNYALHPHLAIIQVGNNPASTKYIEQKKRAAATLNIRVQHQHLPDTISKEQLQDAIYSLNNDSDIHGIIVQAPLPSHLQFADIIGAVSPLKDVDGLHPYNQGGIATGASYYIPCTPGGILRLLHHYEIPLKGSHVLIINRSTIVGRPLAQLLLNAHATVTVAHSATTNLPALAHIADIVISATGIPGFVTHEVVHPGSVIIDVGCSLVDDCLLGDMDPAIAANIHAYTPVPGGIGPLTVASLLANVVQAARYHAT